MLNTEPWTPWCGCGYWQAALALVADLQIGTDSSKPEGDREKMADSIRISQSANEMILEVVELSHSG